MEVGIRVVQRMLAVLEGHHATDQLGRLRHHHVATDDRTEIAAGAGVDRRGKRLRQRQRPHCVGLRLLLPADREHGLVHTGLDHRRGDACGGTANRPGGVDPHDRLADAPEGLGEVHLGHHHTLEEVRCLAHDHGVDVVPTLARHLERIGRGFPQHPGHRAGIGGVVLGLADPENGCSLLTHDSLPFQDGDKILLQARTAGGRGDRPVGVTATDALGCFSETD